MSSATSTSNIKIHVRLLNVVGVRFLFVIAGVSKQLSGLLMRQKNSFSTLSRARAENQKDYKESVMCWLSARSPVNIRVQNEVREERMLECRERSSYQSRSIKASKSNVRKTKLYIGVPLARARSKTTSQTLQPTCHGILKRRGSYAM
jgi:hypothetical protein